MGVREEIEGLPTEPVARPQRQAGYAKVHDDYINRADVLSILDERLGKCVAEDEAGKLIATRIGDLLNKSIKPRDRIAIYRRKQ